MHAGVLRFSFILTVTANGIEFVYTNFRMLLNKIFYDIHYSIHDLEYFSSIGSYVFFSFKFIIDNAQSTTINISKNHLKIFMNDIFKFCLGVVTSVVFLSIGLPTLLLGCKNNSCESFSKVEMAPTQYIINEYSCYESGIGSAVIPCFKSLVKFQIVNQKNETCQLPTADDPYRTKKEAQISARKYEMGSKYSIYQSKQEPELCALKNSRNNVTTIVGIFFLVVGSICAFYTITGAVSLRRL